MGLQWTKLRRGATLQCNVDRLRDGGLTVGIHLPHPAKSSQTSLHSKE
jgi:hypothetical protein